MIFEQTAGKERNNCLKTLTPLKAIRAKCINCSGFELKAIKNCQHLDCPLYTLRMGKGARATLKRIKAFCLWCCNDRRSEIKLCAAVWCSLWAYRFGKRRLKLKECPVLPEILTTDGVLEPVTV
jgi:hypothetical protein